MAEPKGDSGTVIGPDACIKGELEFEKGAQLLGTLEGQVRTKGAFKVAQGARLQGEVQAGSIQLDGEVQGNLQATEKVHLSASAKLEGDLHTTRLEVADGAIFIGRCVVGQNGQTGANGKAAAAPGGRSSSDSAEAKAKIAADTPAEAKK